MDYVSPFTHLNQELDIPFRDKPHRQLNGTYYLSITLESLTANQPAFHCHLHTMCQALVIVAAPNHKFVNMNVLVPSYRTFQWQRTTSPFQTVVLAAQA